MAFSRSLTRPITFIAFSPCLMTTTPAATSPLPSSSAIPRRISGPSWICATSCSRTGVPFSFVLMTISDDSVLSVLADPEVPVGLVFLEMELAVEKLQPLV